MFVFLLAAIAPSAALAGDQVSLDDLERFITARKSKLGRACLTCLQFDGWMKRVQALRERSGREDISQDAADAKRGVAREVRNNMLQEYIRSVEARSTGYVVYGKNNSWDAPEGRLTVEFKVTRKDEAGTVVSVQYLLHTIAWNPATEEWRLFSEKTRDKSERQRKWEGIREKVLGR